VLTSSEPLDVLHELGSLRAALDAFEREQVRRALASGESFGGVARALGISRQAAHRRYRHLLAAADPPRRVVSPEARAVLQRARREAAVAGAGAIELEHVALALTRNTSDPLEATSLPNRIGPRLAAALARVEGALGVEELRRLTDRCVRP
jgi:hypothetical protein